MTKSKKIRAYLAKHPDASAREIRERFDASISMAYRLIQESKKSAVQQLNAVIDSLTIAGSDKMADDAHQHFDDLENAATMQRMLTDAQNISSSSKGLGVNTWQSPIIEMPKIPTTDAVNHPPHYKVGGIETIDFIEAKGLNNHYHLANAVKYISRAPYKNNFLEDVKKAAWYLQREIERHEKLDLAQS